MSESIYSDPAVRNAIAAECSRRTLEAMTEARQAVEQANNIATYTAVRIADALKISPNGSPLVRLLLADYDQQREIAREAKAKLQELRQQLYGDAGL